MGRKWESLGRRRIRPWNLVTFTIKAGKPFDPNQVIDLSEDPEMASLLFEE